MNKMVEFIKKEAEEKAKEVKAKANEEYEIEKANIVRSEIAAIDQAYEQKYKQNKLAQQITKSTLANKTRLKVLDAKEKLFEDVVSKAHDEIKKLPANKAKYEQLLSELIEECMVLLKEETVIVRVREADTEVAKSALVTAIKTFKSKKNSDIAAEIDTEFLPKSSIGGIVALDRTKRLSIDNTLDERLKLLSTNGLPLIRLELFGPSANRRFFD